MSFQCYPFCCSNYNFMFLAHIVAWVWRNWLDVSSALRGMFNWSHDIRTTTSKLEHCMSFKAIMKELSVEKVLSASLSYMVGFTRFPHLLPWNHTWQKAKHNKYCNDQSWITFEQYCNHCGEHRGILPSSFLTMWKPT